MGIKGKVKLVLHPYTNLGAICIFKHLFLEQATTENINCHDIKSDLVLPILIALFKICQTATSEHF